MRATSARLCTAPGGGNNHLLPNDTGWLLGTGQVLSPGAVYNIAASPVYSIRSIKSECRQIEIYWYIPGSSK